ncbi:MAG: GTPase [Pseudomonadota bacterium]
MNASPQVAAPIEDGTLSRKPRVMIAGEFSAGKSRLINALVGSEILPSNVTSTALPPIWVSAEAPSSYMVGVDGDVSDFDLDALSIETVAYCVLAAKGGILDHVDLIDTPGNSDPNIPSLTWERMLKFADTILWCTSAMQAWKQSEKATCADLPADLLTNGTLLITQADRMPDQKSAEKVARRVIRDASSYFPSVMIGSMMRDEDVARVTEHLVGLAGQVTLRGEEPNLNLDGLTASEDGETSSLVDFGKAEAQADADFDEAAEEEKAAAKAGEGDAAPDTETDDASETQAEKVDPADPEPEADEDVSTAEDLKRKLAAAKSLPLDVDADDAPLEDVLEPVADPTHDDMPTEDVVELKVEPADDADDAPAETAKGKVAPKRRISRKTSGTRTTPRPVSLIRRPAAEKLAPTSKADEEAEADAVAEADAPETVAEEKPAPKRRARRKTKEESKSTKARATTFGMANGTVSDLWNETIADTDLSDNERFLACVDMLLGKVQGILKDGAAPASAPSGESKDE